MKKTIALLLTALMLLSLAACGGSSPKAPSQSDVGSSAKETAVPDESASEEVEVKDSVAMYEAFLQGEEPLFADNPYDVYINNYCDYETGEVIDYFKKDTPYSITDFINILSDACFNDYRFTSLAEANYTYIDCGNDGEPELVLSIGAHGHDYDGFRDEYLIKNLDGKLQLLLRNNSSVYSDESFMNKLGLISSTYSGSYISWSQGRSFVNADGKKVFLHDAEIFWGLGAELEYYYPITSAAHAHYDEIGDDWELYAYNFNEIEYTEDFEWDPNSLVYSADPDDEPLIKQIFEEAEVPFHTSADIDAMIAADCEKKGFPMEAYDLYEELDWQPIDNPEVEKILLYGAHYTVVSTVEELMSAIASNTTVVLKPGDYNVTQYLLAHKNQVPYRIPDDYEQTGVLFSGTAAEPELIISNLEALRIVSENPNKRARILSDPRYANVVSFVNCDAIELKDIVMGHTDGGECSGNVLGLNQCYNCRVEGCDLFGCGYTGLELFSSSNITVYNTEIRDCSWGIMESYDSTYIYLESCDFHDVYCTAVFASDSIIYINDCAFKNIGGDMIYSYDGDIYFTGCTYDRNASSSVEHAAANNDHVHVY